MSAIERDPTRWLTLSGAASHLGVHPTTLRRWADSGKIPVFATPGGHRRFRREDLDDFEAKQRRLRTVGGLEVMWADRAVQETRLALRGGPNQPAWLAEYDGRSREQHRHIGRRLIGVTMQYVALRHGGEGLIEEAREIGRAYAADFQQRGESLPDALHKLFFFRDGMLETALHLPEAAQLRPEANQHLFRRLRDVFNAVELAIVEAYRHVRQLPSDPE